LEVQPHLVLATHGGQRDAVEVVRKLPEISKPVGGGTEQALDLSTKDGCEFRMEPLAERIVVRKSPKPKTPQVRHNIFRKCLGNELGIDDITLRSKANILKMCQQQVKRGDSHPQACAHPLLRNHMLLLQGSCLRRSQVRACPTGFSRDPSLSAVRVRCDRSGRRRRSQIELEH